MGYSTGDTGFNSRAREGRDRRAEASSLGQVCFNSRAREGRDGRSFFVEGFYRGFNSRAREGRDVPQQSATQPVAVSIHAPVRGATGSGDGVLCPLVFQFTRP